MLEAMTNFFGGIIAAKYAAILARAIMYTLQGMLCVFVVVVILIIAVLLLNIFTTLIESKK